VGQRPIFLGRLSCSHDSVHRGQRLGRAAHQFPAHGRLYAVQLAIDRFERNLKLILNAQVRLVDGSPLAKYDQR
jgi:hypothetical protein